MKRFYLLFFLIGCIFVSPMNVVLAEEYETADRTGSISDFFQKKKYKRWRKR
jgi:hypothetical protein